MSRSSSYNLIFRDLGSMPYAEAFTLQRQLQRDVIDSRDPTTGWASHGYVLLVEHDPPVITAPTRANRDHLLASPEMLQQAGIELHETDRGGDITYHGPGQLVVYPILDLNAHGLRLRSYMEFLEQVVIDVLAEFGIAGHRDPDATGVWVKSRQAGPSPGPGPSTRSETAKICAMGVRLTRWVSRHGVALNVAPDLSHFNSIIPCGLVGRSVTSMAAILGDTVPALADVKQVLEQTFSDQARTRIDL